MTDALHHILPPDPREAVSDAYRQLACEERPGNPYAVPFDPRVVPGSGIRRLIGFAAFILFVVLAFGLAA